MTNTTPMHAVADPVLTIDKRNLRGWINEINAYQASFDHMNDLCSESMSQEGRTSAYDALNVARCAVRIRLMDMTGIVALCGGLLLIGAPASTEDSSAVEASLIGGAA